MPISHRTHRPARSGAAPILFWPAMIVVAAMIMFVISFGQTSLAVAVAMGLVTLAAGGVVLTMFAGNSWITQLRGLVQGRARKHR